MCVPVVQAVLAIKFLACRALARVYAKSSRDVCCTRAVRAGHRMSLTTSQHRSHTSIMHTSTHTVSPMTTLQEVMIATVSAVPKSPFSWCETNPAFSWQPTCCQAFALANAGANSAEWRQQQDLDDAVGISAALRGSTTRRSKREEKTAL